MASHAESTLLAHLDDVESVEYLAKDGMPLECIPTEGLRPVVEWTVEYYFNSGRQQAPSKEAIRATWGQQLDDMEVTLGDGSEEDTIAWAVDDLKANHVQVVSGDFARSLATEIFDAPNPQKVAALQKAAHTLTTLALSMTRQTDAAEAKVGMEDAFRQYEARAAAGHQIYGATFGLMDVDRFIGGVHEGELCVIAAGPKTGKSFMLARIAWQMLLEGKTVVLFTLENSVGMTYDRLACLHLGIDPDRWRRGECTEAEMFRINAFRTDVLPNITGTLHVIKPQSGESVVESMVRQATVLEANCLLIDQLTFIDNPGGGRKARHENIRDIVHDLKSGISTGAFKIPCFLAHQINREGVKQASKEGFLTMEMLAEGSEVERTADFVFGLYRSAEQRAVNMCMLQMLATRRTDYKSWSLQWDISNGLVSVLGEVQPT